MENDQLQSASNLVPLGLKGQFLNYLTRFNDIVELLNGYMEYRRSTGLAVRFPGASPTRLRDVYLMNALKSWAKPVMHLDSSMSTRADLRIENNLDEAAFAEALAAGEKKLKAVLDNFDRVIGDRSLLDDAQDENKWSTRAKSFFPESLYSKVKSDNNAIGREFDICQPYLNLTGILNKEVGSRTDVLKLRDLLVGNVEAALKSQQIFAMHVNKHDPFSHGEADKKYSLIIEQEDPSKNIAAGHIGLGFSWGENGIRLSFDLTPVTTLKSHVLGLDMNAIYTKMYELLEKAMAQANLQFAEYLEKNKPHPGRLSYL